MSGGAMVSWAITVVSEFDSAGRRIPESVVPLLPMVDVVLWAKEQPQPVRVDALQKRFGQVPDLPGCGAGKSRYHAGDKGNRRHVL